MKILLSDWHLAPFRAEKFRTQKKNFFETVIQFFALRSEKKEGRMLERMRRIVKKEGIKAGYSNGDFMESRRTERGMNTFEDLAMACQKKEMVKEKLGLEEWDSNMGNHESGYNLPLCTDPEAGINLQAIKNFLVFTGRDELYYSFFADGCKIIFVPYIFSEEMALDFDLVEEKRKFLEKMRLDLAEDVPAILLVHDPDSFDDIELLDLIWANRNKIRFIFFGHYHAWINLLAMRILSVIYSVPWLGVCRRILYVVFLKLAKGDRRIADKLVEYFYKRRNIPAIIKELGAILIPAPGGTFGIGGGYLVLNVEKGTVKKRSL